MHTFMQNTRELPERYSTEGLYFEAKSASNGIPPEFWESYSAFANTLGGTIALGISEDKDGLYITGVSDPDQTLKVLWDSVNNPRVVNYNILKHEDVRIEEYNGMKIIVVNVPAAERRKRPIYIKNNINSGTFKRNHEGDYHCKIDEIKEMIRDSESGNQDGSPIENMDTSCFDDDTISRYLSEIGSHRSNHPWLKISREEFLQLSGAAVKNGTTLHPTEAGLLMFGKNHCIRRNLEYYFLDYRETTGTERWNYRIHSNSGEWSGNVYDFVNMVMDRLSFKIGSRFTLEGFVNTNGSEMYTSIREAVINAVIHADYKVSGGVTIVFSEKEISIRNPGTMRVKLEYAMKGGYSDPRNNTLMGMAMAVGWVERIGSGIYMMKRAHDRGMLSHMTIVEDTDPSSITVSLGLASPYKPRSERETRLLNILRENPRISREDMAGKMGLSVSTVASVLNSLKSEGVVSREGGNRNGRWIVRDP